MRRLLEARTGRAGKREYIQILRLTEIAPHTPLAPVAGKRRREPGRKTRPARSARDGGPNIVE
jgi:hypothetical protein